MITDAQLAFVPIGSPLSCVGATGASFASGTVDLLGQGVGTAPAGIIGNATVFGSDPGIGGTRPQLDVAVGTAFVSGDSATLNCEVQYAPDSGVSGGYQPGTWQTVAETGPLTAAQLVANQIIARYDFPPAFPANARPRYMRLLFTTPTGTQFSAGTIAYAITVLVRDDQANKFQPGNFVVA